MKTSLAKYQGATARHCEQAEHLDQGSVGKDPGSRTQVFCEIWSLNSASPGQPNLRGFWQGEVNRARSIFTERHVKQEDRSGDVRGTEVRNSFSRVGGALGK